MENFKNVFKEEAEDLLNQLENLMIELEEDPADSERIAASFRCMHTIKGNAAMFGFNSISHYAHNLESALDSLREGRITVTKPLIDLMLTASDDIRELLDADGISVQRIEESEARVVESLRLLADGNCSSTLRPTADAGGSPADIELPEDSTYRILFEPGPDIFMYGTNPLLLLKELEQMGEMTSSCDPSGIPPLNELNPERCYVNWEIVLRTRADENEIRDVFIFVEDSSKIEISKIQDGSFAKKSPQTLRSIKNINHANNQEANIRVRSEKLDLLVDLAGELVTAQARLSTVSNVLRTEELSAVAEQIERLTARLRESIMSIRMLPVGAAFNKFKRLVRDLSEDLGKDVELITDGEDTELDKTVIERLHDPLVHLIRNSVDHGIEKPAERTASGKPETGTVKLSACHSGASVVICIEDDGGGLDTDAIRARAVRNGLISRDADLSEQEVFRLIFTPGFSTAENITDVSGRGVGMDVVRREIEELQGVISIRSERGQGTSLSLRIPLTLAVIDGLLVVAGGQKFILPLSSVEGCREFEETEKTLSSGTRIAEAGGALIPYFRLADILELDSPLRRYRKMIVLKGSSIRYGLVIDEVIGNSQTVIKPLGRMYKELEGVSGASVLGDGSIALILDVNSIGEITLVDAGKQT